MFSMSLLLNVASKTCLVTVLRRYLWKTNNIATTESETATKDVFEARFGITAFDNLKTVKKSLRNALFQIF